MIIYPTSSEGKTAIGAFQVNQIFSNAHRSSSEKSDNIGSPFSDLLKQPNNNMYQADKFDQADLVLFSDLSLIDQNIMSIPFPKNVRKYYIYAIRGSDEMANKANLALYMNRAGSSNYIPRSFVLNDKSSMKQFANFHQDGNMYILKKNVQRQEGTLITTDMDYIVNMGAKDEYVVCQELLQNPFIVGGRKINMRIYLLVVADKTGLRMYIYHDGFMYYTPEMFEKGRIDRNVNITTGYIDRKVYEENPLTVQDFLGYLGPENGSLLQRNLLTMFADIKKAYTGVLLDLNNKLPGTKFSIYGVDVAPDENLNTMVIEINKGPDLSYKDERDKNVKLNMVQDCFTLVGITDGGQASNFVQI